MDLSTLMEIMTRCRAMLQRRDTSCLLSLPHIDRKTRPELIADCRHLLSCGRSSSSACAFVVVSVRFRCRGARCFRVRRRWCFVGWLLVGSFAFAFERWCFLLLLVRVDLQCCRRWCVDVVVGSFARWCAVRTTMLFVGQGGWAKIQYLSSIYPVYPG